MEKNKSGAGIASFVLGLISVLTVLFWYMVLPTGILAIVFGSKSISKAGSKLGKAGLILGIVGLAISFFIYISLILILLLSSI